MQQMRNKKRERNAAEAQRMAQEMSAPYRDQINTTPALLSLLYDIDLLPEQVRLPVNAIRMSAVCECFKLMTPEAIQSLMTRT